MKLRQWLLALVAALIFGLFLFLSGRLSKREAPPKLDIPKPIKAVEVFAVKNRSIQTQVPLYGRLTSFEKIEIYSEVAGMLQDLGKPFRPGVRFAKGELMMRMDNQEQVLALKAQKAALLASITQILPDMKIDFADNLAAWETYRRDFSTEKPLADLPKPKSEREQDYLALKNIYNQFYQIQSTEERMRKYAITAPFAGELTESLISTGSYIRAGQKLGTLMNTSNYELEASVALKDLKFVKVGDAVALESEEGGNWSGRISRISSTVDTRTQTIKVYVQVSGAGLRENLYLSGKIAAETQAEVVELQRALVQEEQVFGVKDSQLVSLPVQIVKMGERTALVRGLPDGTVLLKENFAGAFDGMKVSPLPLASEASE